MKYHPQLRCEEGLRTMINHRLCITTKHGSRDHPVLAIVLWMAFVGLSYPVHVQAQFFGRTTVIRNARIITQTGPVIENGSILIKGSIIKAVGANIDTPFLAHTIDVGGQTITPGLIDAWSALGRLGDSEESNPTSKAWDSFDRFGRNDFREALSQGVTSIYLNASGGHGITGTGAVIQLAPGKQKKAGRLLKKEVALCIQFGSDQAPVARLKTFNSIRKKFKSALEYRESLEDYEEDLEEYLEKLKEQNKDDEKPKEEKNKNDQPEEEPKPDKDKPEKDDKSYSTNFILKNVLPTARQSKKPNKENKEKGEKEDKTDEKEDDELKKPKRPRPDRESEVLLQAIDHEFPIRVHAHRSADILNAMELAKEFNLDLMLEGATDAYLIAHDLAEAKIPVVLGPLVGHAVFQNNEYRRHNEYAAAVLNNEGVLWTIGSGGRYNSDARFIAFQAQLTSAHGAGNNWLRTITSKAADILEVSNRIGRIAPGLLADLVVWSSDPGDPSAKVEKVFVRGRLAFDRSRGGGR